MKNNEQKQVRAKQFGALFNEKLKIKNEKFLCQTPSPWDRVGVRADCKKIFNSSFFIFSSQKRTAFTLSEVLITLAVIGVVAALTIPVLIQKYNNMVVENKLKNFYTIMQQAIKMSEAENGELKYWHQRLGEDEGISVIEWYKKYLGKYIKSTKISGVTIFLPNGSSFAFGNPRQDISFYTSNKQNCDIKESCRFKFILTADGFKSYGQGVSKETLRTRCLNPDQSSSCTGYIHINGWKIPEDYPYKVK